MSTIPDLVTARQIVEILHFTHHDGAFGILTTGVLLPNAEVKKEKRLESILKLNVDQRKDPQWAGYNSMSITKPNLAFLQYSMNKHGTGVNWWCIFAFDPVILDHEDVVFVTGNNTWPRRRQGTGFTGLADMFADTVPGTYGSAITRDHSTPPNVPTSLEAEVLYKGPLRLSFMRHVYFAKQDHAYEFVAEARTLGVTLPDSAVALRPELFR
jgi:hypothetical protein